MDRLQREKDAGTHKPHSRLSVDDLLFKEEANAHRTLFTAPPSSIPHGTRELDMRLPSNFPSQGEPGAQLQHPYGFGEDTAYNHAAGYQHEFLPKWTPGNTYTGQPGLPVYSPQSATKQFYHQQGGWDSNCTFSIPQATNMIPQFEGEPERVTLFCRIIRGLQKELGPGKEDWLKSNVSLRLKGQAAKDFLPFVDRFSSLEQLLVAITEYYSDDEDMDQVRYQLKTIRHGPSGKVTDYGQRVMILLSKLQRSYSNNNSFISVEKFCYQQQGEQEALKQFLYGLRPDIQYLVSIRQP